MGEVANRNVKTENQTNFSSEDSGYGYGWRSRMCPDDSELYPFETKALEELEEQVQLLALRLDHFLLQKSAVLSAYRYLHQNQIPQPLQQRIDFLFRY